MDPETHDTLCIACNLCAVACPEDCIDVIAMDVETVASSTARRSITRPGCVFCRRTQRSSQ